MNQNISLVMDFQRECSGLQSVDDNELIPLEQSGIKLNNNGANYVEDVNGKLVEEVNVLVLLDTAVVSPSVTVVAVEGNESSSPAVDKRWRLKKWRRVPRDLAKKTVSILNITENGDLTVSSVRQKMDGHPPVQPVFAASADSDRSSSRSSTAASNLNGENSLLPDYHHKKGRIGLWKKSCDFKVEKENTNSTMGITRSDFGSSNFVFVQDSNDVASKGRKSDDDYDDDDDDDYDDDDKDLTEEAQISFVKSDDESDDVSLAADNILKVEESKHHDPLVESIKGLHLAYEELEKELQKFREARKDDPVHEILELKDAKILELETSLDSGGVKTELDDSLMKIIQADVEYVVLTSTTKRLTEGPLLEIKHSLQQKKQDGKLERKEELKKLQKRVCRFTSCFMLQLILLVVTLYMKFSPQYVEVVPT